MSYDYDFEDDWSCEDQIKDKQKDKRLKQRRQDNKRKYSEDNQCQSTSKKW